MKIELTPEQNKQVKEDEVLEIKGENGLSIYFEFKRNRFDYCELDMGADDDKGTKKNTVVFDREDLSKIIKREPYNGYGNSVQCPKCGLALIYKFNFCPECGQAIKWDKH